MFVVGVTAYNRHVVFLCAGDAIEYESLIEYGKQRYSAERLVGIESNSLCVVLLGKSKSGNDYLVLARLIIGKGNVKRVSAGVGVDYSYALSVYNLYVVASRTCNGSPVDRSRLNVYYGCGKFASGRVLLPERIEGCMCIKHHTVLVYI